MLAQPGADENNSENTRSIEPASTPSAEQTGPTPSTRRRRTQLLRAESGQPRPEFEERDLVLNDARAALCAVPGIRDTDPERPLGELLRRLAAAPELPTDWPTASSELATVRLTLITLVRVFDLTERFRRLTEDAASPETASPADLVSAARKAWLPYSLDEGPKTPENVRTRNRRTATCLSLWITSLPKSQLRLVRRLAEQVTPARIYREARALCEATITQWWHGFPRPEASRVERAMAAVASERTLGSTIALSIIARDFVPPAFTDAVYEPIQDIIPRGEVEKLAALLGEDERSGEERVRLRIGELIRDEIALRDEGSE